MLPGNWRYGSEPWRNRGPCREMYRPVESRDADPFDYTMHMQIRMHTHSCFPILSGHLISISVERYLFGKL